MEALKSVVKTIAPPTETKPIRPKAKKNVLVDSDEEWDDAKDTIKEEAGPSSKKAKTVSNNDDDLCDSDDKESAYKDDENGSDDNNDDEDSFIDEDSDDEAEARRKKAKKAKSTPNTAAKSTPKASAKTTPSSKTTTSIATGSKPKTTAVFGIATPASKTASVSDTNPSCEDLQLPEGVVGAGSHEHNSWDWFKPANRRDSEKRKMSDPNYDHRTVLVPDSFLKEQTPAMLQWWTFKKDNLDSVLFFKVGKFYELFHMDADVGVADLDLIYMKGAKAHSGFPEVSYGKFAATLVSKGHRVARVEQTETPDMLKERNDRAVGKKDKVVAREICSIMSKGTRTYCHLDDLTLFNDASVAGSGSQSSILVCIKEKTSFIESNADMIDSDSDPVVSKVEVPEYGVCVVDTVLGTITLAQFQDDLLRSRLRTMLASHTPNEVLLEKNTYSAQTLGVVRLVAPQALVESLRSDGTEMPSSGHTVIKTLTDAQYFGPKSSIQSIDSWPDILKAVLSGLSDGSSELAVCALGGAVWQMQRALIDFEVLSMKRFYGYVPPDEAVVTATEGIENSDTFHNSTWASKILSCGSVTNNFGAVTDNDAMVVDENTPVSTTPAAAANISSGPSAMILDAVALSNLEILQNNFDHTEKGSLWAFVNRCKTPFGQRCMKEWLCHPLYQSKHIQTRTNAIEELLTVYESQAEETRNILKNVADLERLLSRVHSNSLKRKGPIAHPDSRAIMYEDQIYNSRKIKDFIDILSGFEILLKIENIFAKTSPKSILLQKIVKDKAYSQNQGTSQSQGRFPAAEMSKLLKFFRDIFDEKQAKANGFIKPKPGGKFI